MAVLGMLLWFGVVRYRVGVPKCLWNLEDEILIRWVGCNIPDLKLKEK